MTNQEIAEAFSAGKFQITFPFLADNIEWNIVGENLLQGKESVMQYGDQTAKYFTEVTTEFTMDNLVVGNNCVAIDGTAVFTKKDGGKNYISSCDVYRFEGGMLKQINSYCISTKKIS